MSENKVDLLEVGKWLGRREVISQVAGRRSAADAKCLRELHESKKYKELGLTWEETCKQKVGICRSSADQIIRNLEEFGPDYFVIAQVTGISANEYRRISASVANHALQSAGKEIPIAVENAPRLIAAVDALRWEAVDTPAPIADTAEAERSFAKAERASRTALAEWDKLLSMPLDARGRMRLQTTIGETAGKLQRLEIQVER